MATIPKVGDKILDIDKEQSNEINDNKNILDNTKQDLETIKKDLNTNISELQKNTEFKRSNLSLASGWSDIGYSYVMTQGNLVELRFFCYNRSGGNLTTIANLPVEYRPAERIYTQIRQDSNIVRARVEPNGDVVADANVINQAFIGANITYFKK